MRLDRDIMNEHVLKVVKIKLKIPVQSKYGSVVNSNVLVDPIGTFDISNILSAAVAIAGKAIF